MKRIVIALIALQPLTACQPRGEATDATAQDPTAQAPGAAKEFQTLAETFADVNVLRYQVPGFEQLSAKEKELVYYLYEAALAGYDIHYDQNGKDNLAVRRTLEAIVRAGLDAQDAEQQKVHTYAKRVWFSHGVHHHYSSKKFEPEFSKETLAALIRKADPKQLPLDTAEGGKRTVDEHIAYITPVIFDTTRGAVRVNRADGADLAADSANNYYEGVTQKEVEAFYKAKIDPKDERPISWGLNSKLVKVNGKIEERTWKSGGMYGAAIDKIAGWLDKAAGVAENAQQKATFERLAAYYRSGDLRQFDEYNKLWVRDVNSRVDAVNGFIETYGDAMAYRASWESVVSIKDMERSKRISTIGGAAKWFEDNSSILDKHKKDDVVGISAKVITVVVESGDAAPVTPVGINLPNANWIRKEHGSKSVFLGNIVDAYNTLSKDSGVIAEFAHSDEVRARAEEHAGKAYALKVDMHEVIGHASGQLEEGVGTPKETLKAYGSSLEEARADLVALYFLPDPKLVELGVMESLDVGKAGYDGYVRNALLTQLARIEPGDKLQQTHMRSRHMIANWALEKGADKKVIERFEREGNFYYRINDYAALRALWGELLREVQRIKSQGDFEAGKKLIETYGVQFDTKVHANVLERYAKLPIKPYSGFIQPKLVPVQEGGKIVDVKIEYPDDFTAQMLEYAEKYSYLPTYN